MKNFITYLLPAIAALLLVSCNKERASISPEEGIQFNIGTQTKGLLFNSTLKTTGTLVQVYDVITDADAYSPSNDRHIDDELEYSSSTSKWSFVSEPYYLWPATGSQRFFGWLKYDAVSDLEVDDLTGALSLVNNKTLRVPASSDITMTKTSPQFDFSYSNTVARTGDSNKREVNLELQHMFTAISFSAKNTSSSSVTIKSFVIKNMRYKNNASIVFNASGTEIEYGAGERPSPSVWTKSENVVVATSSTVNNILSDTPGGDPAYYLMWPHVAADFTAINYDEGSDIYAPANDNLCYATIVYNQGGGDVTRDVAFPIKNWSPGVRYLFTIQFADKLVQLNCSVLPWDVEDVTIDYSDGTVQANTIYTDYDLVPAKDYTLFYDPARLTDDGTGNLTIDNSLGQSTVYDSQKKVYVKNGMPVKVRFNLNSPEGAEWLVSLSGDYQAFDVEKLTDNLIDGTNCDFQLVPKSTGIYASPTRNYEVNIRVALRLPNGRIVSADPVLQGPEVDDVLQNQYTIVLPKV